MLHETIIKKYPWAQFIHFNKNVFVMFFLFFCSVPTHYKNVCHSQTMSRHNLHFFFHLGNVSCFRFLLWQ